MAASMRRMLSWSSGEMPMIRIASCAAAKSARSSMPGTSRHPLSAVYAYASGPCRPNISRCSCEAALVNW